MQKEALTADDERTLMHWLYVANARGHFSRGSTETLLDADLSLLFRQKDIRKLFDPVRRQFGRLTVEASDFEGRNWHSPLYSTAYLALKRLGAKDWKSGLALSLTHQGKQHFIEAHHIFAKSRLQKAGVDSKLINEIAKLRVHRKRNEQMD